MRARSLAKQALDILGMPEDASLNISFVNSRDMRYLNKKYFNKDRATDVISLGYRRDKGIAGARGRPYGLYIGDIIICPDTARRNADIYGKGLEYEVSLYIIHGILHLLGYQDTDTEKREKMRRTQESILEKIWKR
jgi:rRNA maturation RNase YbeY